MSNRQVFTFEVDATVDLDTRLGQLFALSPEGDQELIVSRALAIALIEQNGTSTTLRFSLHGEDPGFPANVVDEEASA